MAAPPKLRRLNAGTFKVPDELRPFVQQLLESYNSFSADTSNALNKRLSVTTNFAAEVKTVTVAGAEPGWLSISNFNTGVNNRSGFASTRYAILPEGRVRLEVAVDCPATNPFSLFDSSGLPEAARPRTQQSVPFSAGGGSVGTCFLNTVGSVLKEGAQTICIFNLEYEALNASGPTPFTGNDWPILLTTDLKQVTAVIPLQFQDVENSNNVVPTGRVDWVMGTGGKVSIRSVWGLQPRRRYNLSFLLLS